MTQQNVNAKRKRLSTRSLVISVVIVAVLIVALAYASITRPTAMVPSSNSSNNHPPNSSSNQTAIIFNFDTGSPSLVEGQNTPFNQTTNGLTASFSSPSDSVTPAFSIQSYDTTFIVLPQFSGNWLYDNKPTRDSLIIRFNQSLTSINFTFATRESRRGSATQSTNVTLTAYANSTDSTPIGTATASGTFTSNAYPQGTLSFTSVNQPFNLVRIEIPDVFQGVTDFFIDNITVITAEQNNPK